MSEERKKLKRMIALRRQIEELSGIKRTGPFELKEPYQKGWRRSFILRADIANRDDHAAFRYVLKHINNELVCSNKKFVQRDPENRKRWIPVAQPLNSLSVKAWEQLSEDGSPYSAYFRKYFVKKTKRTPFYVTERYVWMYPWVFEYQIEPNMITHYYDVNGSIVSQIDDLEKEFDALGGWGQFVYMTNGRDHRRGDDWYHTNYYRKFFKSSGVSKVPLNINSMKKALREIMEED